VRFVIAESGSDAATIAREAERLIRQERVDVIFGCGAAAGRRSVVPVVEANDHLLIHTGPHEGFEQSPHVFSTGITANQQVGTAVRWCREVLAARRFAIVSGSEIWSRCVAAVAADQVTAVEGDIAGEARLSAAESDVEEAVRLVGSTRPDAVLCTLPGAATIRLLERLAAAGIEPERTPVIAFGVGEEDLRGRTAGDIAGHYSAAGYFQSIDRPENLVFLGAFRSRFGAGRAADAAAASANAAVRLWAQAVRGIGTAEPRQVRHALVHQSLAAAEGIVAIDADTQHAWRPAFIGRLRADGQFDVVAGTPEPLRPVPFPPTRSRRSWDEFVEAAGGGTATRRRDGDTASAIPMRSSAGRDP
jgi:urea transport system substrate-binding protein